MVTTILLVILGIIVLDIAIDLVIIFFFPETASKLMTIIANKLRRRSSKNGDGDSCQ